MRNVTEEKRAGTSYRLESWDSFGEFMDYVESNPNPKSSDTGTRDEWAGGTKNLQEAVDMGRVGYRAVRPEVDRMVGDLVDRISGRLDNRYEYRHNVCGSDVDMGRYVEGVPECMTEWVSEPAEAMGRVVKVVINQAASAYVTAEQIRARGAAVVALVDTIHKLGVGLEVWFEVGISDSGVDKGNRYGFAVKIHSSEDPMDIDSIMFALAHPSMFRRGVFSAMEMSEKAKQMGATGAGGGYGWPCNLVSPTLRGDYDVVVEKLQRGTEKADALLADPVAWVLDTVEGLGIL
jgi:hypothetical protein